MMLLVVLLLADWLIGWAPLQHAKSIDAETTWDELTEPEQIKK
ncbi:hypothetical protein PC110_g1919 [Phytophthora cactorum]|uniref:Uncharacterized protein n=1 Tax=Phytophthora cactorum TaxID=29920 RepID=A0A329SZH8_9STRA|nr:hypothetical protein PC110_g1919 [Phytophthora cactorum]